MRRGLLTLVLGLFALCAFAQEPEHIEKRYTIYFRVNETVIDTTYMGNAHTVRTMLSDVATTLEQDGNIPNTLVAFASASPEGSVALNERLALQRAEAIRSMLITMFPQFDPAKITTDSRPNDWSGLALSLRRDPNVPHRDAILNILNDPRISNKEAAIRSNPVLWQVVRGDMLNKMRTASIVISVIGAPDEFVAPELHITSPSPINFPAEGGTGVITYAKSIPDEVLPLVATPAAWVSGINAGPASAPFVVAPNMSRDPRTTVITVECYDGKHEVVINQAAAEPVLTITSPSPMHFPAKGGEGIITFSKNIPNDIVVPTLTALPHYIALKEATPDQAIIKLDRNEAYEPRTSVINVEYEGKTYPVEIIQDSAKAPKPFYMDIRTNMLYDAALVPNIGVEFYLGKNFSIMANWMYSWWKNDPSAWYWRIYGGDLALRYWFGKAAHEKPLTGHHVGIYGQAFTYDFEVGGRGYIGGKPGGTLWDELNYAAGVEYGYSLPIARRLNIDFTIGLGYWGGIYYEYLPIDGHYVWQSTKRRNYFGPTKLEISLVWLIGQGNVNKGKGGKR